MKVVYFEYNVVKKKTNLLINGLFYSVRRGRDGVELFFVPKIHSREEDIRNAICCESDLCLR